MDIKDIKKQGISKANAIRVDNVPLPLLTNVVQLAINSIPNVTEMINEGVTPPESLNQFLDSIGGLLGAARGSYLAACQSGGADAVIQGMALMHTMETFKQCREYALSQVAQVH